MTTRIKPPSLPTPLVDDDDIVEGFRMESTWDNLASTILAAECYIDRQLGNRVRWRWLRYSLFNWCCGRPMRIGVCDKQKAERTFGWTEVTYQKHAACGKCGRYKDVL